MDAMDVIRDLRGALDQLKSRGHTTVALAGLEQFLAAQEALASGDAQARGKLTRAEHDLEVWKTRAPLEHASSLEGIRWAIEAGGDALRTLVLVNGGAAVALLAFLGNVLTKEAPEGTSFSLPNMKIALVTFVFSVGLAGVGYGARYLTQYTNAAGKLKMALGFNYLAIVLGLSSLAAFFRGGLWAYWAF